ncbi:MAG: TetR/AcrR family transcriptional regulator [Deltaproteobacteria bacterium]|nr:TetR/AcrR family transcriptional regulator [Deltaproteobacteria bacterium]
MSKDPDIKPRKSPRQRRSQITVDAILEAAARILQGEPRENFTTNRIAEVAGVSVGSLYQYFPNKQALLIAVAQRWGRSSIDKLRQASDLLAAFPAEQIIEQLVDRLFAEINASSQLYRELVREVLAMGLTFLPEIRKAMIAMVADVLRRHADEIIPDDPETAAFTLVVITATLIQSAVLYEQDLIESGRLQVQLTALLKRYLVATP